MGVTTGQMTLSTFTCLLCTTLEKRSLESRAIDRWAVSQSFMICNLEMQIDAEKVRNKTEDITRGTVQKSVCVLSRLPLYGQIQVSNFPRYFFSELFLKLNCFCLLLGENVSHHSSIF